MQTVFHSIVTRFSVPDFSGLRASKMEKQARVQWLFSDSRLKMRFELFEEHVLPALALAQSNKLVHLSILYSKHLPRKWKAKLRQIVRGYDFVELVEASRKEPFSSSNKHDAYFGPVIEHEQIARSSIRRHRSGGAKQDFALLTHRLDDDDIVSKDFFERIENFVRPENNGYRVSLARGLGAIFEDGRFYYVRDVFVPSIAIGHPKILFYDSEHGPLQNPTIKPNAYANDAGHTTDATRSPMIVDGTKPSWIWTQTPGQDSRVGFADEPLIERLSAFPPAENSLIEAFGLSQELFSLDLPPSLKVNKK